MAIYDFKGKVSPTSIRFTIDLDQDRYAFLKKYSEQHGLTQSIVLRALLYILETDEKVANDVVELLFSDDETAVPLKKPSPKKPSKDAK